MKKKIVLAMSVLIGGAIGIIAACYTWAPDACPCVKDWGKVCMPCDEGGESCTWRTEGPKMDCAWSASTPDYEKHDFPQEECVYQKVWQECDGTLTYTPMTNMVTPTYSTGWEPPCQTGGG